MNKNGIKRTEAIQWELPNSWEVVEEEKGVHIWDVGWAEMKRLLLLEVTEKPNPLIPENDMSVEGNRNIEVKFLFSLSVSLSLCLCVFVS
jgi:hypothetical protein